MIDCSKFRLVRRLAIELIMNGSVKPLFLSALIAYCSQQIISLIVGFDFD